MCKNDRLSYTFVSANNITRDSSSIPWLRQGLLKEGASRYTPYREHPGNHSLLSLYQVPVVQAPARCLASSYIISPQQSVFATGPAMEDQS